MNKELTLEEIPLSAADASQWRAIIDKFSPEDGLRAALVSALQHTIKRHQPSKSDDYLAAMRRLPKTSPLSFLPMKTSVTMALYAATLITPGVPADEAFHKLIYFAVDDLLKTPVFQIIWLAVGGDLGAYLEASMSREQSTNYQDQSIKKNGPRHYTLYLDRGYPDWDQLVFPPYLERLFERCGVVGTLNFKVLGERSSRLDVRW